MALFKVQDYAQPFYVVAPNYQSAIAIWKAHIALDSKCSIEKVRPPDGVEFICYDSELILPEED